MIEIIRCDLTKKNSYSVVILHDDYKVQVLAYDVPLKTALQMKKGYQKRAAA